MKRETPPGQDKASLLVQAFRCLRLVLRFAIIALRAAWLYPRVGAAGRAHLKARGSRELLSILGVEVDSETALAPPGSLIVANHVSWLDIFVINTLRPAAFVSKSEVRGWPFVGWLAAKNDTVFLSRGKRGHARDVNADIDARLDAGLDVVVFPEGTTTDGTRLLTFHSALLQPAIETGHAILPLALSYHDADGRLSTAPAFTGEATLMRCFRAILATRSLTARLRPCATIEAAGKTRREASEEARAAIAAALARNAGFAPAATAPAAPAVSEPPCPSGA